MILLFSILFFTISRGDKAEASEVQNLIDKGNSLLDNTEYKAASSS